MDKIVELLTEIRPEFDFNAADDFVTSGMLDSFDIITLVVALDETYAISISGTDIIPENFSSFDSIIRLIGKYREMQ